MVAEWQTDEAAEGELMLHTFSKHAVTTDIRARQQVVVSQLVPAAVRCLPSIIHTSTWVNIQSLIAFLGDLSERVVTRELGQLSTVLCCIDIMLHFFCSSLMGL